jgi:MYXO-CTERM domain-containing protein
MPMEDEDGAPEYEEEYAEPDTELYAVEDRRGCGCRLAGQRDDRAGMVGWLLAGVALALWAGRRSRRQRPRHSLRPRSPHDEVRYDP